MVCRGAVADGAVGWVSGAAAASRRMSVGTSCPRARPVDRDGAVAEDEDRCASEPVVVGRVYSDVGSSRPETVGFSGADAACARSPPCRSSATALSPPPTRATAVATTARRWFFFQRASCRRRAARPGGADCAGATDCAGARDGVGGAVGTLSGVGDGTGRAATVRPPEVTGAMSGA
ncbi:hypothetical protein AQJ64_40340 [Streptomyces griseoruber]|uniref:Uncharacterized protein n=1 Tax=Streptomyces griseoruber TaxID=1943 RepID=A0A101SKK4_9ACTN|nr:hypothetical protein AQJ64_40340 [Streptomyces griseoruber]